MALILTGANSSVGIPATEHLLKTSPQLTLILTVRQLSDEHTSRLREVISHYPSAKTFIHHFDLAAVRNFAITISSSVASEELPQIKAIICNAMHWNLISDPEITVDGYDKTFQVGHIAHVALVLQLLGSFNTSTGGRIVLLSSQNHYPGKSAMEKIPPKIDLSDMNSLVHTSPVRGSKFDHSVRGFEIYSNMKLSVTTWMHALNYYLQKDSAFHGITAVAVDPDTLCGSRAFTTNTPRSIINMQKYLLRPLQPLYSWLLDKSFRRSDQAAVDIVELATNRAHPGARGYFTLLDKDESAPQSLDTEI
ncbi:hypothetical protein HD806DRAFT_179534 [Xylariaceae sp. AK1471]|nr:hypothetical protein HD806DRAFT_179534 [Xylariaceae sp. AK1471]